MLKIIKPILKIVEWVLFVFLLCLLFVVISPKLPIKNVPKSFVVVTGSMEPTIKTGSVAFTKEIDPQTIKPGDIIAFTSPSNSQDTILHRVSSISSTDPLLFKTKGDNNNDIDAWDVQDVGVKGVYLFAIPYLGLIAAALKQPLGFSLIIGIPALIFIVSQIFNIKKAMEEEINRKVSQKINESKKDKPGTGLKSLVLFLLFSVTLIGLTRLTPAKALYSDTVTISGITLTTADFTKPSTPSNLHWSNPNIACNGATNSYTITPTWDNSDTDITKYEYEITYPKLDGTQGVWSTFVTHPWYTGTFNQAEGLHTFRVRSYDANGNVSDWSDNCSITYDKTLPTSTITKPWNSDHDNDVDFPIIWLWDGKVEGTASDNFELDHVELSIYRQIVDLYWNGNSWVHGTESTVRVNANGTNNWSYQIDPMYIPLGKFKIVAHAVDKAGNIENSATIEFENSDNPNIPAPPVNTEPQISLSSDYSNHQINLKIDNISNEFEYEILYTDNDIQKGIFGKVSADQITNSQYSTNIYLGICSAGGACVPDNVPINSEITVNITSSQTFTKTFTY